jgi:N-acyl-phosphatidylethanolamine-hydrolysing phospholipase D
LGRRLGPFDLAAIAIGHYEPRWFMRNNHINPEEAVRIHGEIGARRSLGIHWGTFEHLTPEPLDQPLRDLAAARLARGVAEEEFFVLRHGQTRVIE